MILNTLMMNHRKVKTHLFACPFVAGKDRCIMTQVIDPKSIVETFPNDAGVFDWQIVFEGTDKTLAGKLNVS